MIKQFFWTIGTAAVTSAVLLYFFNPLVVLSLMGILFVHEFSHYFVAKYLDLDPKTPWFIPFVFIPIGATYLDQSPDPVESMAVALAGPLAGISAATLLSIFSFTFGYSLLSSISIYILLGEITNFVIGPDSKKIRKGIKSLRIHDLSLTAL